VPVLLDRDIANSGADSLSGGTGVLFVSVQVLTVGGEARPLEVADPDHYLRLGWFSLGDHFSVETGPELDWWRAPVYVDLLNTLWTPVPTDSPGGSLTVQCTRIRWSLGPGTTAHLHVFGD
jgi:hypothetical protein